MVRLWLAECRKEKERLLGYSWIYRVLNFAAGIGPVIVFSLPYQKNIFTLFFTCALICLISALILKIYFKNNEEKLQANCSFKECVSVFSKKIFTQNKSAFFYLLVFFIFIYLFQQCNLLAFDLKLNGGIPKEMGWILAINPIMVVATQGIVSKFFYQLEQRKNNAGIVLGFFSIFLAFSVYSYAHTISSLIFFIIFLSIGEMLICPHIDFLMSKSAASKNVCRILFGLSGTVMGLGRALSQTLGIAVLAEWSSGIWWNLNTAFVFVIVLVVTYVLFYPMTINNPLEQNKEMAS